MTALRPVVTIAAAYGTGGGFVARTVAERLGVGFVDRAIPASVAAELAERTEDVLAVEDDLGKGLRHWLTVLVPAGTAWTGISTPEPAWNLDEASYKEHIADVLKREAEQGAVILGRGAALVLRDHRGALHVRLDGPVERRIAQAIEIGGIDEHQARRAQHQTDTARHRYVQRLYHTDVADARHYHIVIDATAVPLVTCVEIILTAVDGGVELRPLTR